jgi:hypothetical protein
MKSYNELAAHIKNNAITRGKTKGNAPVGRVKNSSREFIRYENGDEIHGWMDNRRMFIMYPDGRLFVPSTPYHCPSMHGYMSKAVGLTYWTRKFKSASHQTVCAEYAVGSYLVKDAQWFTPDGKCTNPSTFHGIRVDKPATAQARAKIKDFASLYVLWFSATKPTAPTIVVRHLDRLLDDEDQWDNLCDWLKNMAYTQYIKPYWGKNLEAWNDPMTHIKDILRRKLTEYEQFDTGVYVLTPRT